MTQINDFNGKVIKSIIRDNSFLKIDFTDGSYFSFYPTSIADYKLKKIFDIVNSQ